MLKVIYCTKKSLLTFRLQSFISHADNDNLHVLLQASSYCIGNAAYHNQDLYEKLGNSIPDLVKLLNDPTARIRTNAAGKVYGLGFRLHT